MMAQSPLKCEANLPSSLDIVRHSKYIPVTINTTAVLYASHCRGSIKIKEKYSSSSK